MNQEQKQLFELFKCFAKICDDNGIKYFLVGGTLLGAVRHKGFIPWDDDIDVAMPEEDYRRFLELKDNLPEGLEIRSEKDDPEYPFLFCKLSNPDVPFITEGPGKKMGIYIDLFPIVPSRDPNRTAGILFNISTVIGYVLQVKLDWIEYIPYKKIYARVGYALLNLLSVSTLRALRLRVLGLLRADNTGFCFSPGGGHKGLTEFYPKAWFDEQIHLSFEGEQFTAPNGWNGYLTQLYGDYMSLPPENNRISSHKNNQF